MGQLYGDVNSERSSELGPAAHESSVPGELKLVGPDPSIHEQEQIRHRTVKLQISRPVLPAHTQTVRREPQTAIGPAHPHREKGSARLGTQHAETPRPDLSRE